MKRRGVLLLVHLALVHLDTGLLLYALATSGPQRRRLLALAESDNDSVVTRATRSLCDVCPVARDVRLNGGTLQLRAGRTRPDPHKLTVRYRQGQEHTGLHALRGSGRRHAAHCRVVSRMRVAELSGPSAVRLIPVSLDKPVRV